MSSHRVLLPYHTFQWSEVSDAFCSYSGVQWLLYSRYFMGVNWKIWRWFGRKNHWRVERVPILFSQHPWAKFCWEALSSYLKSVETVTKKVSKDPTFICMISLPHMKLLNSYHQTLTYICKDVNYVDRQSIFVRNQRQVIEKNPL